VYYIDYTFFNAVVSKVYKDNVGLNASLGIPVCEPLQ